MWGHCPVGLLSCGSAGTIVEGWVVLTVLKNNDKRRIFICRSSFDCHITDSDVALCSVCFACMLRLSWLCGARVGRRGVWRWMVRAGAGGRRVWMMVVTWKGCGITVICILFCTTKFRQFYLVVLQHDSFGHLNLLPSLFFCIKNTSNSSYPPYHVISMQVQHFAMLN